MTTRIVTQLEQYKVTDDTNDPTWGEDWQVTASWDAPNNGPTYFYFIWAVVLGEAYTTFVTARNKEDALDQLCKESGIDLLNVSDWDAFTVHQMVEHYKEQSQ